MAAEADDRCAAPTGDDAAGVVACVRACLGAGPLPAAREADLVLVVRGELERWWLRGRAHQALEVARALREEGEVTP